MIYSVLKKLILFGATQFIVLNKGHEDEGVSLFSAMRTLDVLNTALALFGPTFLPDNVCRLRGTESLRAKPGSLASDEVVR